MDPVQERKDVLALLTRVVGPARAIHAVTQLIPPRGAQIGYAIRGHGTWAGWLRSTDGSLSGDGKPRIGGPCTFGCDEEIARALITVMRFDPRRRSAALVRFSDRATRVLEDDLFLECASYDPKKAPGGISTMDWSIASCCRAEVPDVIFPRGPHDRDARDPYSGRRSERRCKQYYYLLKPHLRYRILEESFMGIKPSYIKTIGTELLKQQRDYFSAASMRTRCSSAHPQSSGASVSGTVSPDTLQEK